MRIAIATDAWQPQINGVVRTLTHMRGELLRMGHEVTMITPNDHRTIACPTYPEIRLAVLPQRRVSSQLDALAPEVLHVSTEGPIGTAARRHALRTGLQFTTAFHTRFPEYIRARFGVPPAVGYAWLRRFHAPATRTMVPTPTVKRTLEANGFRNVCLWGRGVDTELFSPGASSALDGLPRPVFLSVGRVAVEKNLEAFLRLDLPGSKVVVGDGPARAVMQRRFPDVRFLGVLPQQQLVPLYRAADVFVFPSRTDTFGLVLLEAMACGLPVAAFPVMGPIDVVGASGAGVLDEDLRAACLAALRIDRAVPRRYAERFSWRASALQFESLFAPNAPRAVTVPA